MSYQDNDGGQGRQMYQGDWKCGSCGGAITELPFQPDPGREDSLKCRDCFRKNDGGRGGGGGGGFRRQMYQGNWKCSGCGNAITELPFQPSPDREDQLQCRECYRK